MVYSHPRTSLKIPEAGDNDVYFHTEVPVARYKVTDTLTHARLTTESAG